jgi:transcriptional/translational regulatory protein YebC/TACO1
MQKKLDELEIEIKSSELQRIPNNYSPLDITKSKSVLKLIEKMEEVDDVTVVYHNLEMTDELITALNEE